MNETVIHLEGRVRDLDLRLNIAENLLKSDREGSAALLQRIERLEGLLLKVRDLERCAYGKPMDDGK